MKEAKRKHTTIALKEIKDSPVANLTLVPRTKKIEELKKSIRATGYWGNIIARTNEQGKVEVVDGQARLMALRQLHKDDPKFGVDLILADLTYGEMIQLSARLNNEVYNNNDPARWLVYCVGAASRNGHEASNIGELLGIPDADVTVALDAEALVNAGLLTDASLDGLTVVKLAELVSRLKREQLERATRQIRNRGIPSDAPDCKK